MASPPPFQLEDQTDEDFFDKLVDDDFSPSEPQASSSASGMKLEDGDDSDDATAFANLSISDDSGGEGTLLEAEGGNDAAKASIGASLSEGRTSAIASDAAEFFPSNANKSGDEGLIPEEVAAVSATAGESHILDGSGGSGIKEVGWSSFYADSSVNDGQGFGSYSDFLSQLEEDAGDSQGKAKEDITGGGNIVSNDSNNKNVGLDNTVDSWHQGELNSAGANGQDTDPSQYWENLYPGWKYDANTGEWYQVDGHEENMNLQGSYGHSTDDWSGVSAEKSDVAYLRQSTQSAVETVTGTGTTESVSGSNQFSHVNNGYPDHMVFDPQYPGWYYDTIAQEWLTLDSYNAAAQTTGHDAHNQQVQNGYVTTGYTGHNSGDMYGEYGQKQTLATQAFSSQAQQSMWDQSSYVYNNTWQSETAARAETAFTSPLSSFVGNQQMDSNYSTEAFVEQPTVAQTFETASQPQFKANEIGVQSFSPPYNDSGVVQQKGPMNFSNDFYGVQKSPDVAQQSFQSSQQFFHAPTVGSSPDGRPPHTLVSFGFGGKLIVMKDNSGSLQNSSFGSQGTMGSSISVLNVAEVFTKNGNASSMGWDTSGYFRCLCQQSFPGPFVGGNVGSKDLNKWLDERIVNCDSFEVDVSRGKLLRLLLSLLKISCQYYGKLRSPFGTETTQQDMDTPEAAVAKLFSFAQKGGIQNFSYAALGQCLQHLPPEAQMRVTASEVQSLLVSGRKMDALQCAQEGQLWGPALVIAAQLGDQFYVDTVKQMALRQLVPGSPLRTLCLLIAGQPAEVFSTGSVGDSSFPGSMHISQHQPQLQFGSNSMLENWEENLAIITANRTKDDELVITHLGDCLWKERSEIIAAHICYLVAETNFEPYSDGARLCLVGADHWKYPRTYASPEAIQRTELYEYSKVLGNSQYILLPFQPYKLIYAHMLAEIGKVSDALKYCQAVLKCLKTGRAPEVEMWKQLVLSLEERIRIHQQGGYTANLAPAKLVGKLLNFFDSTAHRVVGGMPPPAPSLSTGNFLVNEYNHQQRAGAGISTSQSAMTVPSLVPSASMEPIREWGGGESKMTVQARSVSEPVFGRMPRQDEVESLKEKASDGVVSQDKSSEAGTGSRFSRFGFGILKKTVGRVLQARPSREAKLGEENKFYYDDKLKRWVEKGVEPPVEEAALPPPPTVAAFQTNSPGLGSDSNNEMSPPSGNRSFGSPATSENSSGMPPIPSGSNQFSARGRMGVRSRYVDTFNQGRGSPGTMFPSPPVATAKPSIPTNAKFFIPTTPQVTPENEQQEGGGGGGESTADETRSQPPIQSLTSSSPEMSRHGRIASMKRTGSGTKVNRRGGVPPASSRRTASWSGSSSDPQVMSPTAPAPTLHPISSLGFDELQEVEL